MIKKCIFFVFVLFFNFSCNNDSNLIDELTIKNNIANEELTNAELFHTENGFLKVKILAGKIERFKDIQPELILSKNIEVFFYDDSAKVQSTLYSRNAEINQQTKIMSAKNNVILISSDSKKLETEELIWDQLNNKIYTEKKVKIITGKEIIFGKGFISSPDFSKYEINNINGIFDFKNELN